MHSARQVLDGIPLEGIWINHTYEYRQRRCGEDMDPKKVRSIETLELGRLPCWKHLSPEAYRERIADLVDQIESEAAAEG